MVVKKKSGVEEMPSIGSNVKLLPETAPPESRSERMWTKGDLAFTATGTRIKSIANSREGWKVTFISEKSLTVIAPEGSTMLDRQALEAGVWGGAVKMSTLPGREHDHIFIEIAKKALEEDARIKKQLPPDMR